MSYYKLLYQSDCFGCLFEEENGSLEFNHNVVECENYLSLYAIYVTNLTFTENYFNKSLNISYGNGSLKLNSNIIHGNMDVSFDSIEMINNLIGDSATYPFDQNHFNGGYNINASNNTFFNYTQFNYPNA